MSWYSFIQLKVIASSKWVKLNNKIDTFWIFYYKRKKKSGYRKVCYVYGHDARACLAGNFNLKDAPRSGRLITAKFDETIQKIEQDRHINSRDID